MIYLDHAATTALRKEAFEVMRPFLCEEYGNASSLYTLGQQSRIAVENARRQMAALLGTSPSGIYFTSGGTESDNWALRMVMESAVKDPTFPVYGRRHLIVSSMEHPAVFRTAEYLEKQGFSVTYLSVTTRGFVEPAALEEAIDENTALVSIMAANNELGTIQPIARLSKITHDHGALFHTDAVQAFGKMELDMEAMGIDFLSLSGHKFYGPKGVGVLALREGVELPSFLLGGEQERGRRAGTENVAAIAGIAKAAELAVKEREQEGVKLLHLETLLREKLTEVLPDIRFNNEIGVGKLPGYISLSLEKVEGESLLVLLDLSGIAVSVGSACASGSIEISPVIKAIRVPESFAKGTLRLTLGRENTEEEMDTVAKELARCVTNIRKLRSGF